MNAPMPTTLAAIPYKNQSAFTPAFILDYAHAILATARLRVRAVAPYFAIGLTKLTAVPRPGLRTIGVTAFGVLLFDPSFIVAQGVEKTAGLLVHEVLHVLDNHSGRRGTRDPARWNINADRSINTIVRDMGFELPDGNEKGCWPSDLGPATPEGLMAEQYYDLDEKKRAADKAKRDAENAKKPPPADDESDGDDTTGEDDAAGDDDNADGSQDRDDSAEDADAGDSDEGDSDEGDCDRSDGGDTSTPPTHDERDATDANPDDAASDGEDGDFGFPGAPADGAEGSEGSEPSEDASSEADEPGGDPGGDPENEPGSEPGSEPATEPGDPEGVGNGRCGSCAGNALADEKNIDPADERSAAEMARAAKQMAQAIQEHAAAGRGNVPAGLQLLAGAVVGVAKVRWQAKLQRAVKRASQVRAGANVYRFDGPSKRQAGLGYGPGRALMPRPRAVTPNVALVIDTSGSMGRTELVAALREAGACIKALGAPVMYMTCDAAVHTMQKVSNAADLAKLLKGGGGTSFVPPFQAIEAMKGAQRPELVVFITDGGGDAPVTPPAGVEVIWLLVGAHRTRPWTTGTYAPVPWGEVIEVDD